MQSGHLNIQTSQCSEVVQVLFQLLPQFITESNTERIILKSVHIYQRYCKSKSGILFWLTVYRTSARYGSKRLGYLFCWPSID